MSDYTVKIALIASIIMMGYNISEFVSSYKAVSEKASQFLQMAKDSAATDFELRRSNFLLTAGLSTVYCVLIFFSGVVSWLVVLLVAKLLLSVFISDWSLVNVCHDRAISRKSYLVSKFDALFNALMGLAFALILVL